MYLKIYQEWENPHSDHEPICRRIWVDIVQFRGREEWEMIPSNPQKTKIMMSLSNYPRGVVEIAHYIGKIVFKIQRIKLKTRWQFQYHRQHVNNYLVHV